MYTPDEIRQGNKNLLTLATYVQRRQSRLKGRGKRYDQSALDHMCGAPGCLLGHGAIKFPEVFKPLFNEYGFNARYDLAYEFYAIDANEKDELFNHSGCGNAGRNWRKAVKYVREFVAKRELALSQAIPAEVNNS